MTRNDIGWYVKEYAHSARQAQLAGLDGIELHLNHDDLLEWFLSPHTNHRDDEYGGWSLESRAPFAVEVLSAIRAGIGQDMMVGVRFNLRMEAPSGYNAEDGLVIARYIESTGLFDYLHAVVGSPRATRAKSSRNIMSRPTGSAWPGSSGGP
jgi:2,4-dienoyl-CoA reductase-like NADH-dependent reductase (Old Yellow Enzyme family)